ncbi:hypothetical protein V2J09_005771 [Rumex salicifolius]
MWNFSRKGESGFSSSSTAEEVTTGLDASALTAIVTGASSGIGAETTRVLALRGAHVVMAVRNLAAGGEIKEKIVKEIPNARIDTMELDLTSMASVRKFASDYKSSKLPLNLLINNAGVMATPFSLSSDGIEIQFATNYLGHFLLTHLLLDNMKKTSQETGLEGRIVNVSSDAHHIAYREGILFDRLDDESGYSSWGAYGQSKLANILHTSELSRKLKDDGVNITANSLHPGLISTNLFQHNKFLNGALRTLARFTLKSIPQGAATTCYIALHPYLKGVNGGYFKNSNLAKPSRKAQDAELAQKLWDFSINLINAKPT